MDIIKCCLPTGRQRPLWTKCHSAGTCESSRLEAWNSVKSSQSFTYFP